MSFPSFWERSLGNPAAIFSNYIYDWLFPNAAVTAQKLWQAWDGRNASVAFDVSIKSNDGKLWTARKLLATPITASCELA